MAPKNTPKTYKKNPNKKRRYKLSREETPEDMIIRLFKRGRSINFILKKVPGIYNKESIEDIVKSSYKTRRLYKQKELETRFIQRDSKVYDLQRNNEEYRNYLVMRRDEHIKRHKKKLQDHFDKRLETAITRRFREHDYRMKKNKTVEGPEGSLYFHQDLKYDFLKLCISAFPYIERQHGLKRHELDTLLYLHGEGVFSQDEIPAPLDDNYKKRGTAFTQLFHKKRMLKVWRVDREGTNYYTLSDYGNLVINEMYEYMTNSQVMKPAKLGRSEDNKTTKNLVDEINKRLTS